MALSTFSKFCYGHLVLAEKRFINIDEGAGELTATLTPGYYSPTEYAQEVERALNDVGTLTYTVTYSRANGLLTISATDVFDLLFDTGTNEAQSAWELLGFQKIDLTGLSSYVSSSISGKIYRPQFILQSYVSKDDNQGLIDASVNKSASGLVEVVRYGTESFVEFNIRYITNNKMDGLAIRNNPQGLQDAQSLMRYLITKGRFEFVEDESNVNDFLTLILERTQEDQNGLKFKLKEQVTRNLPGIYETGVLVCRVIE